MLKNTGSTSIILGGPPRIEPKIIARTQAREHKRGLLNTSEGSGNECQWGEGEREGVSDGSTRPGSPGRPHMETINRVKRGPCSQPESYNKNRGDWNGACVGRRYFCLRGDGWFSSWSVANSMQSCGGNGKGVPKGVHPSRSRHIYIYIYIYVMLEHDIT